MNADEALAQLRACYDGTGPLLTASYKASLVEVIAAEHARLSDSAAARYLDAATRALAVLDGIGSDEFEVDSSRAADQAAAILEQIVDAR